MLVWYILSRVSRGVWSETAFRRRCTSICCHCFAFHIRRSYCKILDLQTLFMIVVKTSVILWFFLSGHFKAKLSLKHNTNTVIEWFFRAWFFRLTRLVRPSYSRSLIEAVYNGSLNSGYCCINISWKNLHKHLFFCGAAHFCRSYKAEFLKKGKSGNL